jgi:hypothetical protein
MSVYLYKLQNLHFFRELAREMTSTIFVIGRLTVVEMKAQYVWDSRLSWLKLCIGLIEKNKYFQEMIMDIEMYSV